MKCVRIAFAVLLIAGLGVSGLCAQSSGGIVSLKGMSLNGATGLYSIPTGRVGWERSSNLGLDFGYHAIISDGKAAHIPKLSASLFKWVELHVAYDFQPENYLYHQNGTDFIGGAKIQFPLTQTAIAIGGNFQSLNLASRDYRYKAGQVYLAITYAGSLFDMPAETTVVLGKTFVEDHSDSDIDFGMGFDLLLLPKVFDRYVHWITDFANFSYSVEAFAADARYRGIINTGLRVDLSVIPVFSKFKFALDVLLTDVLDKNRAFSIGAVFGIPIL